MSGPRVPDTEKGPPLTATTLDALVIGAGSAGIYQLYRLNAAGYDARIVDAADGVGGVWYWNRYPGCRLDSESYTYGYFDDPEVVRNWKWSEHYVGQPELERYFNYVVDAWGLRDRIDLGRRVESAHFDRETNRWEVRASDGTIYDTRIIISALGQLSAPITPTVPGAESFGGEAYHTSRWPVEPVDFAGKRVAVVGTGSSGVQVIQTIGQEVGELVVFQRTPNWCSPLNNGPIGEDTHRWITENSEQIHRKLMDSPVGFTYEPLATSAWEHTKEERQAVYEALWKLKGNNKFVGSFAEVTNTREINQEMQDFVAAKIRERVTDPDVAAKLIPTNHGYGGKRIPYEDGYFEVFNQPNVTLVDLRETPIERVVPEGIQTSDHAYEFDIIVWASGFDALTGPYDRIDIRGREGLALKDVWANGPRTFAGTQVPGFPNFLILAGPHTFGGNLPRINELHVGFLMTVLEKMRDTNSDLVETTKAATDAWTEHVHGTTPTGIDGAELHYAFGGNVEGKTVVFSGYGGGLVGLTEQFRQITDADLEGFTFSAGTSMPELDEPVAAYL